MPTAPCSAATVIGSECEAVVLARLMWRENAAPKDPDPQPQRGCPRASLSPPLTSGTRPLTASFGFDRSELPIPETARKATPATAMTASEPAAHRRLNRFQTTIRNPAIRAAKLVREKLKARAARRTPDGMGCTNA